MVEKKKSVTSKSKASKGAKSSSASKSKSAKSKMSKKSSTKAKAKTTPKKADKRLEEDIKNAVKSEDKLTAEPKSEKIIITHWEEDPIEALPETPATTPDEDSDGSEKIEVRIIETPSTLVVKSEPEKPQAGNEADHKIQVSETEAAASEEIEDDSGKVAEEHEWHKLDENEKQPVFGDHQWSESTDPEENDHPEWDDEKWQQANLDEEEVESPEWDAEKWLKANAVDEEDEHPEWDEEKWLQKNQADEDQPTNVDQEIEPAIQADEITDELVDGDDLGEEEIIESRIKSEEQNQVEPDPVEDIADVDIDQQSASSVALNVDDEIATKRRFSPLAYIQKLVLWWKRATLRNSIVASVAIIILLIVAVPTPRYAFLNTVGVRAAASITVLDSETQLPLRNVLVSIAGIETATNENGNADLSKVKLGRQQVSIKKSAYSTYTQDITIGIGENNLIPAKLIAVGTGFEFEIKDWLTSKPVLGAEVIYKDNSAYANSKGIAKLNTPEVDSTSISATVTAPGYISQTVDVNTTSKEINNVEIVVARKHLFVSERDGMYKIYKVDANGSNEELIISGTGSEKDSLQFDVSPSGRKSVLIATRDPNIKNVDKFILSGLYVVDTGNGELKKVDSSERIDIVGWIGNRVIYVKVQAGASGQNPDRHRLMSYDTVTDTLDQIAASNFFNDVLVANEYIFYAPSDAYRQSPEAYLFRSNSDGTNIVTVFEKNVWTVLRTDYDQIKFDSDQIWYEGEIDNVFNTETDARPTEFTSRLYTDSPSGKTTAWVDIQDGTGTLKVADIETGEENTLVSQPGVRNPLIWLNDTHLIYRVVTATETADYIISSDGVTSKKITDVADVSGADRWYYFY